MADYKRKKGIKVNTSKNTGKQAELPEFDLQPDLQEEKTQKNAKKQQKTPKNDEKKEAKIHAKREKKLQDAQLRRQKAEEKRAKIAKNERVPDRFARFSDLSEKVTPEEPPEIPKTKYKAPRNIKTKSADDKPVFTLVEGRKLLKKNQRLVLIILAVLLVAALFIINAAMPVGTVEYFRNGFAKMGGGNGYPLLISGDEIVTFDSTQNGVIMAVSDTVLEGYNYKGKQIFLRPHGFFSPGMDMSVSRYVAFDRGATGYEIGNMEEVVHKGNTEKPIYTAAIGRSGVCAFSTASPEYNSSLLVYDKNMKNIFNWYSAESTITAIEISDSGKLIAVATTTAQGGRFVSKLYIFGVKQQDPIATLELAGSAVVSIQRVSNKAFAVICNDGTAMYNWSGAELMVKRGDTVPVAAESSNERFLVVDKPSEASVEYNVRLYDKNGENLADFRYTGTLKDAALGKNCVYLLCDNKIEVFTLRGNGAASIDCNFSVLALSQYDDGKLLEINKSEINKGQTVDRKVIKNADSQ